MALHEKGNMHHDFQVHLDDLPDIGALYLDHDLFTIIQAGFVNLSDRGCGNRRFLELLKQFFDIVP